MKLGLRILVENYSELKLVEAKVDKDTCRGWKRIHGKYKQAMVRISDFSIFFNLSAGLLYIIYLHGLDYIFYIVSARFLYLYGAQGLRHRFKATFFFFNHHARKEHLWQYFMEAPEKEWSSL